MTATLLDENHEVMQEFKPDPVTLDPDCDDCSWRQVRSPRASCPCPLQRHTEAFSDLPLERKHMLFSLSAGNSGQPYIYRVRPRDAIHRLRTRRTRHQVLGRLVWCPGNWELCYCGGVNERGGGGSGRVRVRQVEEEGRGRRAIGGLECRF